MPYEWVTHPGGAPERSGAPSLGAEAETGAKGPPLAELHLWPYRSLPRRGFAFFIGATAALLALPLLAVLGSPVLWALLPFLTLAVAGVWYALSHSYRSGETVERLRLWRGRTELLRHDPGRPSRLWEADPYWVQVRLHETGGPVPNYLTLKGTGREVEIGAFLSEEERLALRDELQAAFARVR